MILDGCIVFYLIVLLPTFSVDFVEQIITVEPQYFDTILPFYGISYYIDIGRKRAEICAFYMLL